MTQPDTFNDYSAALRMREVIAKVVREEMLRERPPARYGKVYSFNRFNGTARVLFPGDVDPTRVKVAPSVQPSRRIEVDGEDLADVVRVEGVPGNLWVTEVVSGPTFQYASQVYNATLMGGEFLHQPVAKHFGPGVSQLPNVGEAWYYGRWTNASSFASDGLGYIEVTIQQSLFSQIVKRYNITIRSSDTTDLWRKCVPSYDSGPWVDNDFDLEMKSGSDYVEFRVRRTQAGTGATPGGYDMQIWFYGQNWEVDPNYPAGITTDVVPTRVHGTDSTEGKGPFLSPSLYLPTHNQFLMTGGGAVTYASGSLKWTERFMLVGAGKNPLQLDGYHQIPVPTSGVSVPVYGSSTKTSVTSTAGAIPLDDWEALYYEPPYGDASATAGTDRFRVVHFSGAKNFTVPSHWVLVGIKNGDLQGGNVRLGNGATIPVKKLVSYNGGWADYLNNYLPAGYTRIEGRVFLEGIPKNTLATTVASGAVPFNLPAGYRPSARTIFTVQITGITGAGRVDIQSNGDVTVMNSVSSGGFVSLDGISFRAEQ